MKTITGKIFDYKTGQFRSGIMTFDSMINNIEWIESDENNYILPGIIDSHMHIESTMLSPVEYSKLAIRYGVIGALADPHEIANVCGEDGIKYMVEQAKKTPMKIFFGIPSCVPATLFETSGARIDSIIVNKLLERELFTHLSEVMDFPGVISGEKEIGEKILIAKNRNLKIDGHAPELRNSSLETYVKAGISTDHECCSLSEAIEKINLGMKIMIRRSSVADSYSFLKPLIDLFPDFTLFCSDDIHPNELRTGYLDVMFKNAILDNFKVENIIRAASLNAIEHYHLPIGQLRLNDPADFIVVDQLSSMNILKTFIDGIEVWNGKEVCFSNTLIPSINNFYCNTLSTEDIRIKKISNTLNVIEVIPDSLVTKWLKIDISNYGEFIEADIENDILKIVVLNRYKKAQPSIGFIKGFGLKRGAFGCTIAHDSHNIIVIGTNDNHIIQVISNIQQNNGGLSFVSEEESKSIPLAIGGLMTDQSGELFIDQYIDLIDCLKLNVNSTKANILQLSFMALLVIPELKISDQGLFSINEFSFIPLQN